MQFVFTNNNSYTTSGRTTCVSECLFHSHVRFVSDHFHYWPYCFPMLVEWSQQFFKRIRFFARSLSCTKIKLAIVRKYYLYFCIWNDVCACERSSNYIIAHTQFDVLFTLYRIDGSLFHYRTLYLMEMKKTPNINHNSTTIGPKQYAQRIIFRHIFCC